MPLILAQIIVAVYCFFALMISGALVSGGAEEGDPGLIFMILPICLLLGLLGNGIAGWTGL